MSDTIAVPCLSRGDRTRKRLLASATMLLRDHDYACISIDRIAEHAGYTRGAIEGQFATKATLAEAVPDRAYQCIATRSTRQLATMREATQIPNCDELAQFVTRSVEAALTNPAWVRLELDLIAQRHYPHADHTGNADTRSGTTSPPSLQTLLRTLAVDLLTDTVARTGVELAVEPKVIVSTLLSVIVGEALRHDTPTPEATTEQVRVLVAHLLRPAGADV